MNIREFAEAYSNEKPNMRTETKPNNHAIKKAHFSMVEPRRIEEFRENISFLNEVEIELKVQLGSTAINLREVIDLHEGQVITLDRIAGDAVDLMASNVWLARGEVLILNEVMGIRISSLNKEEEDFARDVK